MFFTRDEWLGLKPRKDVDFHLHAGFTSTGLNILKTTEHPRTHTTLASVSNKSLDYGLRKYFLEVAHNETDPSDPKFRKWTVLIPKSSSPDSPTARRLFVEKGRSASLTLAPLFEMGAVRALHELFEVHWMADVRGRQFKWALAYPTRNPRDFDGRTLRWVYGWWGRYFMISERKRVSLLRNAFHLKPRSSGVRKIEQTLR
jgi:hypothetical protein